MRRGLLLLGLFAAAAAGSEADGGHAGVERWMHARGPASSSGRSLAWAPDSFGGIRWTFKAQRAIAAAPVTWDGVGFVLDGGTLVAIDLVDGRPLARTGTNNAAAASLCVHERAAFLVEDAAKLVQYRLKGRAFSRRWTYPVGNNPFAPRILHGEIYVATPERLVRLRAGARRPAWRVEGRFAGAPAVFGRHVYAALRGSDGALELRVYQREDGKQVVAERVADSVKPGGLARVVASRGLVAVKVPYSDDWALSPRKLTRGAPDLGFGRTEQLRGAPLAGDSMLLGRSIRPEAWTILRFGKRPRVPLVSRKQRPELLAGARSCVSLNGTLCFGTWATDPSTNRILWHVAERRDITAFAQGVKFHAVPAGHHQLLLVPADGRVLHLVEQEKF